VKPGLNWLWWSAHSRGQVMASYCNSGSGWIGSGWTNTKTLSNAFRPVC